MECFRAVGRGDHAKACALQRGPSHPKHHRLIVHHQNRLIPRVFLGIAIVAPARLNGDFRSGQ